MTDSSDKKLIGVFGAGSFGTAIANVIAENHKVLLYARRDEVVAEINEQRANVGQTIHENITATGDFVEVANKCTLLFPMVPSAYFTELIEPLSPHLRPDHIIIHGIKGFNLKLSKEDAIDNLKAIDRSQVRTMSELITDMTPVIRVGCLSGPNLASELSEHKPAGTVVASNFDEVIELGKDALRSKRFIVFGSHDLTGVELAGALKNILAIASGVVSGLDLGENARALLVAKGLSEIVRLGVAMGGDTKAFLGVAGIGDIIATASSSSSRNFTVGYRLAKGETLQHILETSDETAEGINTIWITKLMADNYKVRVPIIQMLYSALFEEFPVTKGVRFLMKYPFDVDVDFL